MEAKLDENSRRLDRIEARLDAMEARLDDKADKADILVLAQRLAPLERAAAS